MGDSLKLYRTILGLLIRNIPHSAYGHRVVYMHLLGLSSVCCWRNASV